MRGRGQDPEVNQFEEVSNNSHQMSLAGRLLACASVSQGILSPYLRRVIKQCPFRSLTNRQTHKYTFQYLVIQIDELLTKRSFAILLVKEVRKFL